VETKEPLSKQKVPGGWLPIDEDGSDTKEESIAP
jgi:hypothetical protein